MRKRNRDGKLMEKAWRRKGSMRVLERETWLVLDFLPQAPTLGRCLAATDLSGSCSGLLQHGRAVASEAVFKLQNCRCCSLSEGRSSRILRSPLPGHLV